MIFFIFKKMSFGGLGTSSFFSVSFNVSSDADSNGVVGVKLIIVFIFCIFIFSAAVFGVLPVAGHAAQGNACGQFAGPQGKAQAALGQGVGADVVAVLVHDGLQSGQALR